LPDARCAEELQGTHQEHKYKPSAMKAEIAPTHSWRYKTIAAIERQQPTTISMFAIPIKACLPHELPAFECNVSRDHCWFFSFKAFTDLYRMLLQRVYLLFKAVFV